MLLKHHKGWVDFRIADRRQRACPSHHEPSVTKIERKGMVMTARACAADASDQAERKGTSLIAAA